MSDLASQLVDAIQGVLAQNPDVAGAINTSTQDATGHTKAEANYRPAEDDTSCGNCINYEHDCCGLVAGRISSDCVCDLWEVGPAEHEEGIKMKVKIPGDDVRIG